MFGIATQRSAEMGVADSGNWFALKTRAQHEKVVRDRLRKLGFEHLLPILLRVSQWHDRKKVIEAPLFPGYCFARLADEHRSTVLQLPGVAYIVGHGGKAEAIPHQEIEALRRLGRSGLQYEAAFSLVEGDPVEIIRGPLAGVRGTLVCRERSHHVIIGVKLIQQGAKIKVDVEHVRRIEDPATGGRIVDAGRLTQSEYALAAR